MTLSVDDKRVLSDMRFAKAREALADAQATLADGRLNNAVNRSYYAALNAVRALLILDGVNPESHSGAVTTSAYASSGTNCCRSASPRTSRR